MAALAPIYRHIGNRLKAIREAREMTQARLAEAIDRGPEYISAVERGRKRIQLEDLGKAMAALDVSFSEFFQGVPVRDTPRARGAREKPARYVRPRAAPSSDELGRLTQLAAALDDADIAALIAIAQRFMAAGLGR
jgi:transcriptional regulator with XRE-family HTH domain